MSRIKSLFMFSALIIGVIGALAGTPKQLPPCEKFRYCGQVDYNDIGILQIDCEGQDNLVDKDCKVAADGGECDEANPNSCEPIPVAK